jgi:hypothetical protein
MARVYELPPSSQGIVKRGKGSPIKRPRIKEQRQDIMDQPQLDGAAMVALKEYQLFYQERKT